MHPLHPTHIRLPEIYPGRLANVMEHTAVLGINLLRAVWVKKESSWVGIAVKRHCTLAGSKTGGCIASAVCSRTNGNESQAGGGEKFQSRMYMDVN